MKQTAHDVLVYRLVNTVEEVLINNSNIASWAENISHEHYVHGSLIFEIHQNIS